MIEIVTLGTAAGVPNRNRNISATAVKLHDSKKWVLVDCGDGTQREIMRSRLSVFQLEAICITHVHGDHCLGLPALLSTLSMLNRTEPLTLIAPHPVWMMLQQVHELTYGQPCYPVNFIDVAAIKTIGVGDFAMQTVALSHRVPSYGYSFTTRSTSAKLDIERLTSDGIQAGPVWGLLQQGKDVVLDQGQLLKSTDYLLPISKKYKVVIAGDNDQPMLLEPVAVDADIVVHEATYTEEVEAKVGTQYMHSTAARVAMAAEKLRIKNLVLTHFSGRFSDPDELKKLELEASNLYSGHLVLARDGYHYILNSDSKLELVTIE